MTQIYEQHGIRFRYPAEWTLGEEQEGETVAITVTSPETSFWSLWLLPDRPNPQQLIDSAIQAFEDDYDDVDRYQSESEICEYPALSCDIEFVSMELINSAFVRAFRTGRFSVLILYQGTDHELEYSKKELIEITDSLECDLDDDIYLV